MENWISQVLLFLLSERPCTCQYYDSSEADYSISKCKRCVLVDKYPLGE